MVCLARRACSRTLNYFRRDRWVPELLGIRRVPTQSTFWRFFAGFLRRVSSLRLFWISRWSENRAICPG